MPRRRTAARLRPVATYDSDRIYLRMEAARRDILPADVIEDAVGIYRRTTESDAAVGRDPPVAVDIAAAPGKGVA